MRVGIYARVSTLIGQSPEMQLAELREYASRRGWEIYGEYVDSGVSGSKESRPELNRLMSDVHLRRFDVVLCWKVDRFGRSLKHLVNALADLDSYGVAFVSLRDNLDFSTPSGRGLDVVGNALDTRPVFGSNCRRDCAASIPASCILRL
jgi:DNA invertase Pin-like site-specific DNA recombinase